MKDQENREFLQKNMKKNVKRINESQLRTIIAESVKKILKEGAGAGYDVTIRGLNASNFIITGIEKDKNDVKILFKAKLNPSQIEWEAMGYYEGVSSKGIYYDGELVEDVPEESNKVYGGELEGYAYLSDIEYWNHGNEVTKNEIVDFLWDKLSDFSFTKMVGAGWSHTNLSNPLEFNDVEIEYNSNYSSEIPMISYIKIESPQMTETVNWYFENNYKFDEIYGDYDEEDDQ